MNREHANTSRRRLFTSAAHRATEGKTPSLWREIMTGAAVGLGACLLFASSHGGGPELMLAAALLGLCAGGVIGILIWIGVAPLPDDPVIPPARGQERDPSARWRR